MSVAEQANLVVAISLRDGLTSPIKRLQSTLKNLDKSTQRIQGSLTQTARNFRLLGVAAIGAGGLAVKWAGDFEEQLAIINTVANVTQDELTGIGEGLRLLASETGTALPELSSAYYDLVSAGVAAADATEVLRNANILAIGGLSTTTESVDLLTTAINAYGLKAKDVRIVTDGFAQTIAAGKVTASELAQSFARVAPLASAAGIGIDEVQAAYAQMTAQGVPAAEVSTNVRAAIVALQKPTGALSKAQRTLGVNFAKVAKQKGLAVAYQQLTQYASEHGVQLVDLVGRVEATQFALTSAGRNFEAYKRNLKDIRDASEGAGVAYRQFQYRQTTLNRTMARVRETARDVGIEFGSAVAPAIKRVSDTILNLVRDNRPEIRKFANVISRLVDSVATEENISEGLKGALSFLQGINWQVVGDGLKITADAATIAVNAFKSLPPGVQSALLTVLAANKLTGGLVASGLGDIAGFLLRNLTTINAAVVNVVGGKVNGTGDGDLPSGGGGLGNPASGFGIALRSLPIIGFALEAQDRAKRVLRKRQLILERNERMFRPGIITGIPGLTPGLKPELTPRQQLANQFEGTQTLIRAILGSGPQASPGGGGQRVQMQVVDKLTTLASLGDKQNEQASDIWQRLGQGNITYQEANKKLNQLLQGTREQTAAIAAQEMRVNLQPYIQISAAQTGSAITLAATGSRIVIR